MKRALTLITFWFVCAHVAYAAQARQSEFGVRAGIVRGLAKVQARNHVPPTKHAAVQIHTFGISAPPLTGIGYLAGSIDNEGGNSSYAQIAGDFNGDGNKDAATIVGNGDGVTFWISVVLGQGNGKFSPAVLTPVSFTTGDRLYAADLNNDGKADLLVVHTGSFDVFLGNGDGSFAAATNYSDGVDSFSGAFVGNVNGDSAIDVVVLSAGSLTPMVSTIPGNGNGTFGPASLVAFPAQVPNGVFADVNGDGKLDVVSSLEVFLANSGGGYQSGVPLVNASNSGTCGGYDGAIAVADVNGDSKLDIVTADCEYNTVTVFLNAGAGSFQPGTSFWAGFYPQAITVADANGDGILDIISSNAYSSDVTVLTGHGDGSFQPAQVGYSVGGLAWELPLAADFNNDSKADVLVGNSVTDENFAAAYLQGFGDGSFVGARDYFSPPPPISGEFGLGLASADFNGDGRPDFVIGNSGSASEGVTVFLTNADGSMQSGVNYGTGGSLNFVATGDFNGDGKQDIVAADSGSGMVDLLLGNGDGTFQPVQTFSAVSGAEGVAVGDFNHDGKPDVAVMGANLAVLLNDGTGGFLTPTNYSSVWNSSLITTADVNGDGNPDLILPQIGGTALYLLLGKADGTFQSAPDVALSHSNPATVTVADFNGDGKADIAVAMDDFSGMGIAVALGNGDGTFQAAVLYPCTTHDLGSEQPYPNGVAAVDVDHDGRLDLIYSQTQSGIVGILFGKGDGTFYSPVEFPAGAYPYEIVASDVNGDGAQDAVISGGLFSGITVLLNAGGNKVTLGSTANPSTSGQATTFTATVAASVRGVSTVPSGTVTFFDGSTSLGTATLSAGQALLSVSSLASGTHSITAKYSGDHSFIPTTSSALSQVVTGTPSFTISASPVSATVHPGTSANFTVTVTPSNGYSGKVSFSCGSLPKGVTCQFSPTSVTASGAPVTVQLTVAASLTVLSAAQPEHINGLGLWSTGVFGLVLLEGMSSRRRRVVVAMLAILALVAILSLVGCGGANTPSTPGLPGPSGNGTLQTIQVIGTGPASGGGTITQQAAIKLSIKN